MSDLAIIAQGDTVRIVKGTKHRLKLGTVEHIGHSTGLPIDVVPLYLVKLDVGTCVFLRDEIERVQDGEVRNA
jgi:hypothetical protein